MIMFFFFFNDTATTEIYTLSLHDALPIFLEVGDSVRHVGRGFGVQFSDNAALRRIKNKILARFVRGLASDRACTLSRDRKSTRLNSSHANISYAVFCLKKKKKHHNKRNCE